MKEGIATIPSPSRSHNSWFVDLSYIMIRLGGSPELLASSRRNLWSRKQPATSWLSRPKCGFERPPSRASITIEPVPLEN